MFSNVIIGLLIVIFGLSLIIKALFGFSIPILKPLIGIMLIYIGITIIMNSFTKDRNKKTISFGNSKQHITALENHTTYNILFGEGSFDISDIKIPEQQTTLEINVFFGNGTLKINPSIPTKIKIHTAFARVALPDDTITSFGSHTYKNYLDDKKPLLKIHVHVTFGSFLVKTA